LALAVYEHTRGFSREEVFGLTAQLRRSAVSVPSNIVEGCARNSEADYLHFLDVAYASSREVEDQLSLATRLGHLDTEAHREVGVL
jgi:four helix bundle protein